MNAAEPERVDTTRPIWQWPGWLLGRLLIGLIQLYRLFISPLLGPRCRFQPSCSAYAIEALRTHGVVKGLLLTVRRVSRCHPGDPGGYDPVPPRDGENDAREP